MRRIWIVLLLGLATAGQAVRGQEPAGGEVDLEALLKQARRVVERDLEAIPSY